MSQETKDSPVIALLRHVWRNTNRDSWLTLNQVTADALTIAIRGDFKFAPDDFVIMARPSRDGGFDSHRWISGGERFYAMACGRDRGSANLSAAIAFETWRGRTSFLIAQPNTKSRVRLSEAAVFIWSAGERWRVTSFAADQSYLIACKYTSTYGRQPVRRIRITHADLKAFNASLKNNTAEVANA